MHLETSKSEQVVVGVLRHLNTLMEDDEEEWLWVAGLRTRHSMCLIFIANRSGWVLRNYCLLAFGRYFNTLAAFSKADRMECWLEAAPR